MEGQYVNIRLILDNLLHHPLLSSLTLERAVAYMVDLIRIVGVPRIFEDKIEVLEIVNHRAQLPCDWYDTIQIKDLKSCMCIRHATDSFHGSKNTHCPADLTFNIQGNIIVTSFKEGRIELSYRAIKVDEEGLPVLPDNSNFTRALEAFIKMKEFTILFDLGKITPQSLQNTQQEYAWAVGSLSTDMVRLDISKMESFTNSMTTLIMRRSEFKKGFVNDGTMEVLRNK